MSVVNWELKVFKKTTTSWESTGTVIDRYSDVQINRSLGDGKDRFSFKLYKESIVGYQDKIEFRRKVNSTTFTDDDLILVGVVRTLTPKKDYSGTTISVSGYNFSESVMSGLIFVDSTEMTIPELFKEGINSLHNASREFSVEWDSTNKVTTSTGSSFPVVGSRQFNKPFRDVLDKYSAADKTKDGNYHWYVSVSNKLVWARNYEESSNTFDDTTTVYSSLDVTKDVNDVRNFVIVKGGYDPKGRILQERYADYASISKHGFKYYILTSENKTGASVSEVDKQQFGVDDMKDASYPLTPYWSSSSFSSFSDYADGFRDYMRSELKSIGKTFVDMRKNGKLKVSISINPSKNTYTLGSVVYCTFADSATPDGKMRVIDVNYTSTNDGVSFEQDEGSL